MLAGFLLAYAERWPVDGCLASFRGLSGDVVWRADGENALVAADQERPFKEACTLIVQEIFVPAIFDQFGNDDNNMTSGVLFRELENVLNQGNNNEAVGRRQCGERRRHSAGGSKRLLDVALPFLVQKPGMLAGLHVNGDDFWRQPGGKFYGLLADGIPVVHGHDGDWRDRKSVV